MKKTDHSSPSDEEAEILARVLKALLPLDIKARERVLRYLRSRFIDDVKNDDDL